MKDLHFMANPNRKDEQTKLKLSRSTCMQKEHTVGLQVSRVTRVASPAANPSFFPPVI
jgi:hypothetical protein